MTGQILFRVALPSALLTLLLLAACLGGMWSVAHLQANQAHILSKNVASLLAAQELELRLRTRPAGARLFRQAYWAQPR